MAATHPHPIPRAALVLVVLAAATACSPDLTVAPGSPSFAGAIPIHEEPGIPNYPPPPVPAPPGQCMTFEPLPPDTVWGASVGTPKFQVVYSENSIRLSLRDYLILSGTDTVAQYGDAVIDTVFYNVFSGKSLRLEAVGAAFDFRATPPGRTAVSLRFVDLSPVENMAVDDSAGSVYIRQILAWPNPHANHPVKVEQRIDPTAWPIRGTVTIYGKVDWVRVGGARDGPDGALWLDTVCYHLPQGSQEPPNPL